VDLGLFHATLAFGVAEEGKHVVKRLFRVVQHVGKRSPLSIFGKYLSRNSDGGRHRVFSLRTLRKDEGGRGFEAHASNESPLQSIRIREVGLAVILLLARDSPSGTADYADSIFEGT
jgi:hypothetical protein